jgi:hypothetical protein
VKQLIIQLVKKFHAFYGNQRLNPVFTKARRNQFMPQTLSSISIFNIIPIYAFVFQMILFPSGIPTKAAYAPLLSPMRVHLILFDLMTRIIFDAEYRS